MSLHRSRGTLRANENVFFSFNFALFVLGKCVSPFNENLSEAACGIMFTLLPPEQRPERRANLSSTRAHQKPVIFLPILSNLSNQL